MIILCLYFAGTPKIAEDFFFRPTAPLLGSAFKKATVAAMTNLLDFLGMDTFVLNAIPRSVLQTVPSVTLKN
jgi:hypothetical protein